MSEIVSLTVSISFCCIFVAAGGEREEREEMLFPAQHSTTTSARLEQYTCQPPTRTHTHPTHITTVSGQQHVDDDYNNENALAKRRRRRRRFRLRELFTTTVWGWVGGGGYIEEPGPGTIYPYLGFSSCLLAGFCIGDDGPRPAVIESSSRVFIGETRRKKIRNESSSLLSARLVCKYYTKFMQGPLAGANPHPTSRRWASVQRCAIERKAEALDGDAE
jgi:hypothetical protein